MTSKPFNLASSILLLLTVLMAKTMKIIRFVLLCFLHVVWINFAPDSLSLLLSIVIFVTAAETMDMDQVHRAGTDINMMSEWAQRHTLRDVRAVKTERT